MPSPKSVILDLLSSLRGRDMPVRALVAAGAVFGISGESMRVALARLLRRGTIERSDRGQYRIAPAAQPVQRHVVAWTRLDERLVAWKGGWIGAHTAALSRHDRTQLRRRQRAFAFLGFRELDRHLWVRPDNVKGGVQAVRAELCALGLEPHASMFAMSDLDAGAEARARALWDTAALRLRYRTLRTALGRSATRLSTLRAPAAMVESFVLGGKVIRQLAVDPLLPEPIVPAAERAALVESMRRYDRLGRDCWRQFMQAQGAPHLQMPRVAVSTQWPLHETGSVV